MHHRQCRGSARVLSTGARACLGTLPLVRRYGRRERLPRLPFLHLADQLELLLRLHHQLLDLAAVDLPGDRRAPPPPRARASVALPSAIAAARNAHDVLLNGGVVFLGLYDRQPLPRQLLRRLAVLGALGELAQRRERLVVQLGQRRPCLRVDGQADKARRLST